MQLFDKDLVKNSIVVCYIHFPCVQLRESDVQLWGMQSLRVVLYSINLMQYSAGLLALHKSKF